MNVAAIADERWFHVGRHLVGVSRKRARVFSRHRDHDWGMAMLAIFIGAVCFWPGVNLQVGTPGSWTAGISTYGWGAILIGLGVLRAAAIRINGIWQTSASALIRAAAAFIGMSFWGQILYVAAVGALSAGRPTIGLAIFFWLWMFEARCIVRALDDVSSIRHAVRASHHGSG